jgi:hypothetical protein
MDLSIMPLGLIALVAAMAIVLYDMSRSLKPAACAECSHCRAVALAEAREQEQLNREYARRIGLRDDDEDDRKIG